MQRAGYSTSFATPSTLADLHPQSSGGLKGWLRGPQAPDLLLVLHAFKCGAVIDAATEAAAHEDPTCRDPPPVILVFGGTDVNIDAARGAGAAESLRRRCDAASRVVAFSRSMLDAPPAGTIPPAPKTIVIPQGVNLPPSPPSYRKLHDALGVPAPVPVLLLPAGLRPVKDVLWAAQALESAAEASYGNPSSTAWPPFIFAICGPELDAAYAAEIRANLGLEAGVVRRRSVALLPPVPRPVMLAWMAEAAAVLNTSASEGQSGALLEAAALGTPLIARGIPGNRNLFELLSGGSCAAGGKEQDNDSPPEANPRHAGPGRRNGGYEVVACGFLAASPEDFARAAVQEVVEGPSKVALQAVEQARAGALALAARESEAWSAVLREVSRGQRCRAP